MPATLTITDIVDFLHSQATEADLDVMIKAIRNRRKALGDITAAAVKVGINVRLDVLSPKYLNGLTGTVSSIDSGRAHVDLDENSTDLLRERSKRFYVSPMNQSYTLRGIPMSCCHKI